MPIPRTLIADDQPDVLTGLRLLADSSYQQHELELRSGDRLLLFTDGITEVRNASDEEFSEERLRELLARERRHDRRQVAINHHGSSEGVLRQPV